MRLDLRKRLRPVGGLTGAAIALAGGLGAAVGTYSLPDPQHAHFGVGGYGPGTQAVAVQKEAYGDGYREIRIYAGRTTALGAGGTVGPDGSAEAGEAIQAFPEFVVSLETCMPAPDPDQGDSCGWAQWGTREFPPAILEFDPALRSARFTGTAWCHPGVDCGDRQECFLDVRWTGEGEAAPGSTFGLNANHSGEGEQNLGFHATAGVSRVAPAEIDACFGSFSGVPGFLNAGNGFGTGGAYAVH